MQPLEVMPMLGSAPSSPTSLNTKLRGRGWWRSNERFRPLGPVKKTPSGREGPSGGGGGCSSWRQPENAAESIRAPTRKAFACMMHRQSHSAIILPWLAPDLDLLPAIRDEALPPPHVVDEYRAETGIQQVLGREWRASRVKATAGEPAGRQEDARGSNQGPAGPLGRGVRDHPLGPTSKL